MTFALIVQFLEKNKTTLLVIGLVVVVFMLGRYSKSAPPVDISTYTRQGDSLRAANKRIIAEQILEAIKRDSMQKEYERKMAHQDSLSAHDSTTIAWYRNELIKKRTPHEIETAMLDIYYESHPR